MKKEDSAEYREAYKKVLGKAASNLAFRRVLLGKKKKEAENEIAKFLKDPEMGERIASSIYSDTSEFRELQADTKGLIKLMAYVFGNLPLPPPPKAGDCLEEGEDWEIV